MTTLYKERTSEIKRQMLMKVCELRTMLLKLMDSDDCIKLSTECHAINMTGDVVEELYRLQDYIRESIKQFEWYFKIYPDKSEIQEDKVLCEQISNFLDQLDLESNIKVGTIEK